MGNWDNAMLRSIGFVGLASVFYLIVIAIRDGYQFHEFMMLLVLYGAGYLLISFIGWVLVGLPSHYAISKLSNSSPIYYVIAALFFSVAFSLFSTSGAASFFGVFATIQALVFRYYVYKKT